jgi:pentatricopeptide repeat protein
VSAPAGRSASRIFSFSRRFAEAAAKLLVAMQETPAWPWPYRGLAACYAHMGRLDEAREVIDRLRVLGIHVRRDTIRSQPHSAMI